MALCTNTLGTPVARRAEPLGVVLAGGAGMRMGGAKATVALHGRPLIGYAVEAVWRALGHAVVVAKADTPLPSLPGVNVWIEPSMVSHPLVGLLHALELADSRPIVVCAADLPFVTPRVVRQLAKGMRGASAVLAGAGAGVQPLLAWYHQRSLAVLRTIDPDSGVSLRAAVDRLRPVVMEVDPMVLYNVNTPADLLQAAALMDRVAR